MSDDIRDFFWRQSLTVYRLGTIFSRLPAATRLHGEIGMRFLAIAAAAALLFATAAQAAEMKFPSTDPVASITLPDGWTPNETDTGMEVQSADGSIYLSVDVAEPKDTEQVAKDAIDWLSKEGVTVDLSTQKQSEDKINDRDIFYIDWKGKDKEGDASVGLAALVLSAETVLVLTYWGTPGEEDKNVAAIVGILKSIKPVE
jgi:hypothetical protein